MARATCPTCGGDTVAIETATAHPGDAPVIDLTLRCERGETWLRPGLALADATDEVRAAIQRHAWTGASHAVHGLLIELAGRADDAYEAYATALRCADVFDRGFCHERRAAYEANHGWLRTALQSLRDALAADLRASGARADRYRQAIEAVERALTASGIRFPPAGRAAHDKAWLRACELERPPGFGMRNEIGEPLTDDVIEIERRIRAGRWDDAIAALKALEPSKLVDAIGFASTGGELARRAGRRDAALALQRLVVRGYEIWASWSTSGAEGMGRTADVERERARLREWDAE